MNLRPGLVAALLGILSATAAAQNPDINPGDVFNIETYEGPVLGSSRVIGLAGAYSAVAEDAVGIPWNPASVCNRTYYSEDWWDWDLAFDFLLANAFKTDHFDFDNNDRSLRSDLWLVHLGGYLQFGTFGAGIYLRSRNLTLEDKPNPPDPVREYDGGLLQAHFCIGFAMFDHQLLLGFSVRTGQFNIEEKEDKDNSYAVEASGIELGGLLRPKGWPLRLSMVLYGPLNKEIDNLPDPPPANIVLPTGVGVPWEFRIGASYLISDREYNQRPLYKRRKAERIAEIKEAHEEGRPVPSAAEEEDEETDFEAEYLGDNYVLISVELLFLGSVKDAIGMDGFFQQEWERAGRNVSISPRVGVETELLRRRLRVRSGLYWEPSRYKGYIGRLHWTFSFQLRLFDFSFLGDHSVAVNFAIDLTHRYNNMSFGIGFWN
jgi:hypothetical protein